MTQRRNRMDWRTAPGLSRIEPGSRVQIYTTKRSAPVRGILISRDERESVVDLGSEILVLRVDQVIRWRMLPALLSKGDHVQVPGISSDVWRGVVVEVGNREVVVSDSDGATATWRDRDLELVEEPGKRLPPLRPGPVAEPLQEMVRQSSYEESLKQRDAG